MVTNASKLQRISTELRKLTPLHRYRAEQWQPLIKQISELLIEALRDDEHPLAQDLAELQALKIVPPPGHDPKRFAKTYNQDRRFFTPIPGSFSADQRRFWPLQLLLFTAATSSHRPHLVTPLSLSEDSIKAALTQAAVASVDLWGASQHARYLLEAVEYLKAPEPELELSADGRTLTYGSARAKLSPQDGRFVRLLLKYRPEPVPPGELIKAGIVHRAQTKKRLEKRTAGQGITLTFAFVAGSYALQS